LFIDDNDKLLNSVRESKVQLGESKVFVFFSLYNLKSLLTVPGREDFLV